MAACLDACIQEAGDYAAFIAAALGDIARARGMTKLRKKQVLYAKASTKHFPAKVIQALALS